MTGGADPAARLENVSLVVELYRAKLAVACKANADDARFLTGVTHAQAALDRVQRALDGETDPVRLGLVDTSGPAPAALADLFSVETS